MSNSDDNNTADFRFYSKQIAIIGSRIDELSSRIAILEGNAEFRTEPCLDKSTLSPSLIEADEEFSKWARKGALLQKMATICFILVFALLLRTITDYGYLDTLTGSLLGLAYVSILAGIGCLFYVTGKQMANVFSISGFLLLFTIVYEGYGRFGTIPVGVAYAILLVALLTSALVGIKYRVAKLLSVSLIGVTICGLAIGFPRVHFPLTALVFLAANLMAMVAAERLTGSKLRWPVTLLTLFFWAIWVFKAHVAISRGGVIPEYVYLNWLPPLLLLFVALYLCNYLRKLYSNGEPAVYDAVIPSLNMLLLFLATNVVVKDYWQKPWLLVVLALLMGLVHFGAGWQVSAVNRNRSAWAGGAFVAGSMAMALGFSLAVDNVAYSISFWSLLAYLLVRLSGSCNNGAIRVISYLGQIFAILIGLALGVFAVGGAVVSQDSMLAALSLAVFGFMQFKWSRDNPWPDGSFYAKLDSRDYSAVTLLLVGLTGLYLLITMVIDMFASMMLIDPVNTIKCGRSIIINMAATLLLVVGGRRHDLELVWIAVFLAIIGCIKVFLVDLFGTSGMPLVLSVLSFGVVALTGSIVMGKWHKLH